MNVRYHVELATMVEVEAESREDAETMAIELLLDASPVLFDGCRLVCAEERGGRNDE